MMGLAYKSRFCILKSLLTCNRHCCTQGTCDSTARARDVEESSWSIEHPWRRYSRSHSWARVWHRDGGRPPTLSWAQHCFFQHCIGRRGKTGRCSTYYYIIEQICRTGNGRSRQGTPSINFIIYFRRYTTPLPFREPEVSVTVKGLNILPMRPGLFSTHPDRGGSCRMKCKSRSFVVFGASFRDEIFTVPTQIIELFFGRILNFCWLFGSAEPLVRFLPNVFGVRSKTTNKGLIREPPKLINA